jgi:hypothetical protein
VIDVEPLLISGLDRLVPLPSGERANWQEVLASAGLKPRPRVKHRRLVLVVAILAAAGAVTVATPVGAALGRGFDTFSTWLTGSPGEPSSHAEQRAFDRATRSWAGFPQGTELRRLVQTTTGGATFSLYGFRGAGSLCVRLVVTGSVSARTRTCPPLSALRGSRQPALVVAADYGVGTTQQTSNGPFNFATPKFTVTFGVVADGVQRVELTRSDRTTAESVVNGDTFLAVDSTASPITHAWATAGGKRVPLSLTVSPVPFGFPQTTGPQLTAHGPATVQRLVHGGAIRWLARREPRGTAVPPTVHHIVGVLSDVIFHREITPDRAAPERMVVSVRPAGNAYFGGRLRNKLQVCAEVVGGRLAGGGGCWPAGRLFSTAPFSLGVLTQPGGQTVTIAGLASDDVDKLTLYLATGRSVKVPLHDNGYVTSAVKADYPLRLVASDSQGRVIGVDTLQGDVWRGPAGPLPVANPLWRSVVKTNGGEVFVTRSTTGGTCYAIRVATVTTGPSCQPPPAATELQIGYGWNRSGAEITGRAGSAVARVVVKLRNGAIRTLEPVNGYILGALPLANGAAPNLNPVRSITAIAADGRVLTPPTVSLAGGSGSITRLTHTSIGIGSPQVTHTCRVTQESPSLSGYALGIHVQYLCRNGVLSLIGRSRPSKSATWADRTIRAQGPITRLTASKITVQNTLAALGSPEASITCARTKTSPRTDRYHLADRVQVFCSRGSLTGINHDSP